MEIKTNKTDKELTVSVIGRLDTTTAPSLQEALDAEMPEIDRLVLDFTELEYISSAGLRVLLYAQKKMTAKAGMLVKGANSEIKDIFDMTGFSDILDIE